MANRTDKASKTDRAISIMKKHRVSADSPEKTRATVIGKIQDVCNCNPFRARAYYNWAILNKKLTVTQKAKKEA